MEQLCDPGTGAPPYRHDAVEEVIAVLEGWARVFVEEEEAVLAAGESVLVPAGARHGFTNVGEEALRVLAAFSDPAPTVEYEGEPGTLKIGARGGRPRDDHRVYRVKE